MKNLIRILVFCSITWVGYAEMYQFKDPKTGEWYGPFEIKHGTSIQLGTNTYYVALVQKEPRDVRQTMQDIVLDEVKFRQTDIRDVISFLIEVSRERDPDGHGINFLLNTQPLYDKEGFENPEFPKISMNLRSVSMFDTLKLIRDVTGWNFHIKKGVIVVSPPGTEKE